MFAVSAGRVLAGSALSLLVGLFAWLGLDTWRLRRLPPQRAIATVYDRLYLAAARLGLRDSSSLTPDELLASLTERLAMRTRMGRLLAPAKDQARVLIELHRRATFSPHPAGADEKRQAFRAWRRLSPRLWLARLLRAAG